MKKLNYLLVMPRVVRRVGDGYNWMLGICYVSAAMKAAGFNVTCLNLNQVEGSVKDILERTIERNNIHVVMCGGLSFQYNIVNEVFEVVKKYDYNIKTIVGGGLLSADPMATMQAMPSVDYGVVGEGEETIVKLCNILEGHFNPLAGVAIRVPDSPGGMLISPTPVTEIKDLDSIPFADYEGFGLTEYLKLSPGFAGMNEPGTLFLLTSRSCLYNCTFCYHPMGRHYRTRSMDNVFAEVEQLFQRHPDIRNISISDELFSGNWDRVLEWCKRIKPYNIRWWAQVRVTGMTEKIVDALLDSGCSNVTYGIESASNKVLKSMGKATTIEQVDKILDMTYRKGLSFTGAFIFGDPAETYEDAIATIDWCKAHQQYNIAMSMIQTFPGSHLYDVAVQRGIITDRVKFLKDGCPTVNVSKMSHDQFGQVIKKMMEAQINQENVLDNLETDNLDTKLGHVDITGTCPKCGSRTKWEQVKLFRTFNFLTCPGCGTKYNTSLPAKLKDTVIDNLFRITTQFDRIAIWGMNFPMVGIITELAEGLNMMPNAVRLIDISEQVQKSGIIVKAYGRDIRFPVYSPNKIKEDKIDLVIVALPHHFTNIQKMLKEIYPEALAVDICELLDPNLEI